MSELLLDRAGRRRSPATMPGFHAGHAPGNKGLRYPADPPKVEEIVAVMRASRKRSRSRKATSITDAGCSWCGAAREGAGARSAWTRGDGSNYSPGSSCGPSSRSVHCCASSTARPAAATLVARPGPCGAAAHRCRRRGPAPLRAAPAAPSAHGRAREGVPLIVIQRQLGHSNLGITSVYLQGIDSGEIIETVHARRAPMIPVSASLRL
jgi:hypothetical protein